MKNLRPDAVSVLLLCQQVPAAKAVVGNAAGDAGEVLNTVCWCPGYIQFRLIYTHRYIHMDKFIIRKEK